MTRLSLRTTRSPGRRNPGRLRKKLSWKTSLARSSTSIRLEPRISGGDCAISSSGRSKLKSDTSILGLFFRGLRQFDGAVERGLNGRQVRRSRTRPGDGDTGKRLGNEEAVPRAQLPGVLGVDVAGTDGGVDELG